MGIIYLYSESGYSFGHCRLMQLRSLLQTSTRMLISNHSWEFDAWEELPVLLQHLSNQHLSFQISLRDLILEVQDYLSIY